MTNRRRTARDPGALPNPWTVTDHDAWTTASAKIGGWSCLKKLSVDATATAVRLRVGDDGTPSERCGNCAGNRVSNAASLLQVFPVFAVEPDHTTLVVKRRQWQWEKRRSSDNGSSAPPNGRKSVEALDIAGRGAAEPGRRICAIRVCVAAGLHLTSAESAQSA